MASLNFSPILHLSNSPAIPEKKLEEYAQHFFKNLGSLMDEGLLKKVSLYCNGAFLNAAKSKNGVLLAGLRERVRSGQIEFLGGGSYDPVFPLLPKKMQDLQIESLNQSLEKYLDSRPRGFLPPSFIWENSLIEMLNEHSFEFIVLKDYQLKGSLSRQTRKEDNWILEDRGKVIRVVTSNDDFSGMFRQGDVRHMLEFLEWQQERGREDVVLDIPFFRGKRSYYEADWFDILRRLLKEMNENLSSIRQTTLSMRLDEREAGGIIHLPVSVGRSLGLPTGLKSCRDMLILQPECNLLQKKLIHLWKRIQQLERESDQKEIMNMLLPVQSVFYFRNEESIGGLRYLEDRAECYRILLEAEKKLDHILKLRGIRFEATDLLGNGSKQLLCGNRRISFLVEQKMGGRLRSFEIKSSDVNLINGFREASRVQNEEGVFAVTPVSGMVDRLLPSGIEAQKILEILKGNSGLLDHSYEYRFRKTRDKGQVILAGEQNTEINFKRHSFRVEKVFSLKSTASEMTTSMQLTNATFQQYVGRYSTEMNFSFKEFNPKRQYLRIDKKRFDLTENLSIYKDVNSISLFDKSLSMVVEWSFMKPCDLLVIPEFSCVAYHPESQKFQQLRVIPWWDISLSGQESWSLSTRLRVNKSKMVLS